MIKKIALPLLILFCAISLSSCDFFENGAQLKEQIKDTVEYQQAPYIRLKIEDSKKGTIYPAANIYEDKYKASDSIEVSFEAENEYQFLYWHATPEDCVKFKDIYDSSTKATISDEVEEATTIIIEPICELRPYPTVSPDKTGGLKPKNSNIAITFPQEIKNPTRDLKDIDIQIDNKSILDNYLSPVYENDKHTILFYANNENLLNFTEASKTVTVTIPSIFYITNESGIKVTMYDDVQAEFVIENKTSETAKISFNINNKENCGNISIVGDKQFNLNDKFEVEFTPYEGYQFVKWELSDIDNAIKYDINSLTSPKFEATVTGPATNGEITAVVEKIVEITVNIVSENGTISPMGLFKSYKGNQTNLMFVPNNSSQFLGWRVYNQLTNTELSAEEKDAYIAVEDPSAYTTTLLLKAAPPEGVQLKLVPYCESRPQILSTSPLYTQSGVNRDTSIQVMFDKAMSPSSIYFTQKEIDELIASGNTFLAPYVKDETNYYYGYKDSEGYIHYKNISVTDYTTKKSVLNFYSYPYFDTPYILSIPTKSAGDSPSPGLHIIVEIYGGMTSTVDNNDIYLSDNKKWNYRVNSSFDNLAPIFNTISVTKSSLKEDISNNYNLSEVSGDFDVTKLTNIKEAFLCDNKFKAKAVIFDEGSGPQSIKLLSQRVYDGTYEPVTEDVECLKTSTLVDETIGYFGNFDSQNGTYSDLEFDLSAKEDGVYKISLAALDVIGNETVKNFYVLKKTSATSIKNITANSTFTKIETSGVQCATTFTWENCVDIAAEGNYLRYIVPGAPESYTGELISIDNKNTITQDLLSGGIISNYQFKIKDIFGNSYTKPLQKATPAGCYRSTRIPGGHAFYSIEYQCSSLNTSDANVAGRRIYYSTDSNNFVDYVDNFNGSTGYTFKNELKHGYTYYFKSTPLVLDPFDNSYIEGVLSDVEIGVTYPDPVTDLTGVSGTEQVTLYWNNPSCNLTHIRIYHNKNPSRTDAKDTYIELPGTYASYTITNINSTYYHFWVVTVNSANESATTLEYNTPCTEYNATGIKLSN